MAEEVFDPDEAWESAILRAFEAAEVPLEEPLPEEEVPGESVVPNPDEEEPETKGGPGSGNFGHEGRPGEVGGSAPGSGAGAASRKEGQTLVTRTLVKEGFTYQTRWNRSPRTGFIVSPYKNRERIISQARLKPQDIIAYTRKHRDLLRNRKHFVGGWWNKEKGKVYLDVVIRFDNKRKALTHAEANKQLAIFDLKTKKTIYTRLYYEQEKKSDA